MSADRLEVHVHAIFLCTCILMYSTQSVRCHKHTGSVLSVPDVSLRWHRSTDAPHPSHRHRFPTLSPPAVCVELEAANQRLLTADRDRASIPPPQQQQQQQQHQYQQQLATAEAEAEALRDQVQDQADLIDNLRAEIAEVNAAKSSQLASLPQDGSGRGRHPDPGGEEVGPWGSDINNRAVRRSWSGVLPAGRKEGTRGTTAATPTGAASALDLQVARNAAVATAQSEAEALRGKLAETERELQRMIRRSSAAGSGHDHAGLVGGEGAGGADARGGFVRLERENRRLKEENEKLSNELQAFDLDFFEEIEDLKYKYSEAARKLRQYEDRSPSRDRRF